MRTPTPTRSHTIELGLPGQATPTVIAAGSRFRLATGALSKQPRKLFPTGISIVRDG
jgi:hypothetical protein